MNSHTFDAHNPTCPVCRRTGAIKPHKLLTGLLTCQYCRERLVVTWSGHYVRDPFILKDGELGQRLRRASRPLARIRRDVLLVKPHMLLAIAGSAILLGGYFALRNPLAKLNTESPLPAIELQETPSSSNHPSNNPLPSSQ